MCECNNQPVKFQIHEGQRFLNDEDVKAADAINSLIDRVLKDFYDEEARLIARYYGRLDSIRQRMD